MTQALNRIIDVRLYQDRLVPVQVASYQIEGGEILPYFRPPFWFDANVQASSYVGFNGRIDYGTPKVSDANSVVWDHDVASQSIFATVIVPGKTWQPGSWTIMEKWPTRFNIAAQVAAMEIVSTLTSPRLAVLPHYFNSFNQIGELATTGRLGLMWASKGSDLNGVSEPAAAVPPASGDYGVWVHDGEDATAVAYMRLELPAITIRDTGGAIVGYGARIIGAAEAGDIVGETAARFAGLFMRFGTPVASTITRQSNYGPQRTNRRVWARELTGFATATGVVDITEADVATTRTWMVRYADDLAVADQIEVVEKDGLFTVRDRVPVGDRHMLQLHGVKQL